MSELNEEELARITANTLMNAIEEGNYGEVQDVFNFPEMKKYIDIPCNRKNGTLLMHAAKCNQYDIVNHLLEIGANKAIEDHKGKTAFDYAITRSMRAMLEYDKNLETKKTQKPEKELETTMPELNEEKVLVSARILMNAIEEGNYGEVEDFFNFPGMIKYIDIRCTSKYGTLLMHAAKCNQYYIAEHLLEIGANKAIEDHKGKTAFDYAISPSMRRILNI